MTPRATMISAALAVPIALAGCSNRQAAPNREGHPGAETASVVDGVQQITVVVDQSFRFNPSTITVHPGPVKITLKHEGSGAPHDLAVTGHAGDAVPLTSAGQTMSTTFTAPAPGSYRFVCTIHVAQGM